jgi:hypothetical protein
MAPLAMASRARNAQLPARRHPAVPRQRLGHQVEARQDQSAEKLPFLVRVDGRRSTGHDRQRRAGYQVSRRDQRRPAVRAQL